MLEGTIRLAAFVASFLVWYHLVLDLVLKNPLLAIASVVLALICSFCDAIWAALWTSFGEGAGE